LFLSSQVRFRNSVINSPGQFWQYGYVTYFSDVEDKMDCYIKLGGAVVKALRYKPDGLGIDSRW
jgi:hypothetical protein